MYQRGFNQRSKIRRARQETPIVSVYDISNPQRIYSITVPDSKKWSDFIIKLKTKFNVLISDHNTNNSSTSSDSNNPQYTVSIFQEKASQMDDTDNNDESNNPNLSRVDIFSSDMSKIKHKTTLAIQLIELNPNAKKIDSNKQNDNNKTNSNSSDDSNNSDGVDYNSDNSDNSDCSDSSSFSIGSNYASGTDTNEPSDVDGNIVDDSSNQIDQIDENSNENNNNKHKYDFIPSKEIKEMKKLGMTDLDLLSRFSIPSKSKKGQKPLHRYNSKTLGWDPKTLWIALSLKDIMCYHENDKWTVIKVVKDNNNNNNSDSQLEPNDDDSVSNYVKRRNKKNNVYEESLLKFVTVRVRRLVWPLRYQSIALNQKFNFNLSESSLSSNFKWAIILCHGGRFAMCIFFGKNLVYHKTLRRYVTRKKQGRRQLNYTKTLTTSGPGSAGGQKRAHNEKKLREEIQEILTKCQKYLTPPNWLLKQMSTLDGARNDEDTINIGSISSSSNTSTVLEMKRNDNNNVFDRFDDIENESELNKVDRIFIHVPGGDQMTIFGNSEEQNYLYPIKRVHNYNVLKYDLCKERLNDVKNKNESSNLNLFRLWKDDKRILKIPITSYKPTIQECMRIHYWLSTVWIKMDTDKNIIKNNEKVKNNSDSNDMTQTDNYVKSMKGKDRDDEALFTINEEINDDIDENETEKKLTDNMVDID